MGWPHDTLTKIKANAEKLFEDIYSKIGYNGPPIVFVCHSRGGLVARKAAVIMQEHGSVWANKVRLCVTFGTPHRGAALAESPFQYIAAFVAYMNGTGHVLSACSVLDYYRQTRAFEGIDDLRPPNAKGGEFLLDLIEEERLRGKPKLRALNILPVGSIYADQNCRWARFMTGVLGTSEHDLVVPKKSSLPEGGFPHGELTDCSHGNYFDIKEVGRQYFKGILAKMRGELQIEDAMLQRVIVSAPPSTNLDEFLKILKLKRRDED